MNVGNHGIINIFNTGGVNVYTREFTEMKYNKIKVDLSELPKGIYSYKLNTSNGNKVGSLIIE